MTALYACSIRDDEKMTAISRGLEDGIETAKLSLTGATAEKNEDYMKQNKDSIELWSKK